MLRKRAGNHMDKVGDLLIRIKNGYMASKKEVVLTYSKLGVAICELLKGEGYLESYKVEGREIKVVLKYDQTGASSSSRRFPALSGVKRVSKPGLRIYKGSKNLPYVYDGLGIAIVSTPKGIMSDKQARKEGLGGEVMALVW